MSETNGLHGAPRSILLYAFPVGAEAKYTDITGRVSDGTWCALSTIPGHQGRKLQSSVVQVQSLLPQMLQLASVQRLLRAHRTILKEFLSTVFTVTM